MKRFFICSLLMGVGSLMAQIPLNRTVYDCNGNSKNIHNVLGTGKALIIASKGVDCSICQNAAPGLQSWAAANQTHVEVWGAITYTYNPNNFNPMCTATTNWKNTYSWNNIFTFPDSTRAWFSVGTPRYYVYSPKDSSIVWQGSSQSTAQSMALQETVVGLEDYFNRENINLFYTNNQLIAQNIPQEVNVLRIYSSSGRLVVEKQLVNSSQQLNVTSLSKGIYIVQLSSNEQVLGSRKVVLH